MRELRVIVDNRERNLELMEGLSERGFKMSFSQLPVGDYIISDRLCVERKTMSDFQGSIINSRLFDQMRRLSESFAKPVLIIEGDESEFALNPNVLLGTIISLYIDYNVQVIRSKDADETTAIMAKIAEMEQSQEKREPKILGRKRAFTRAEWQVLVLSSIPGVGPKIAKQLLKKFGNVRAVANASIEELKEVDKIGKKKAEKIHEVLTEEFKE